MKEKFKSSNTTRLPACTSRRCCTLFLTKLAFIPALWFPLKGEQHSSSYSWKDIFNTFQCISKRVGVTDYSSALQCLPDLQHERSSTHPGNCAHTTSWKSKALCQSNHSSMQRRWEILNCSHNILIHQLTCQIQAEPLHNTLSSDKWVP